MELLQLGDNQGAIAVVGSAVLAVLTISVLVAEKLQKLLGPLGAWMRERHKRAISDQLELEKLREARHWHQIEAIRQEAEFYRERYLELLENLKEEGHEDE